MCAALCFATSAEIAISPANREPRGISREPAGNDNTSVALFFPRNLPFKDRTSALLVTSKLTVPLRPAARRARSRKRSSPATLKPAIGFCRITNSPQRPPRSDLCGYAFLLCRQNKREGPIRALPPRYPSFYPLASFDDIFLLVSSRTGLAAGFSSTLAATSRSLSAVSTRPILPSLKDSTCCSPSRVLCSS